MISLLFSASVVAMAALPISNPEREYREYDFNALEKIKVTNTSGKITVSPMPLQKVIISITKKKFSQRCTADIARPDIQQILVEVNKPLGEICEADIDLQVPVDVALELNSGSGDIVVNDVSGPLNFTVGSGAVKAKGDFKTLEGKSGSGDISIEGLTHGGGNLSVGSGHVDVKFAENPNDGDFTVKSGSGGATLNFPKGSKIKAFLEAGSGSVTNDFNDTISGFKVNAKSGSGDVKVKSY